MTEADSVVEYLGKAVGIVGGLGLWLTTEIHKENHEDTQEDIVKAYERRVIAIQESWTTQAREYIRSHSGASHG